MSVKLKLSFNLLLLNKLNGILLLKHSSDMINTYFDFF